MNRTQDTDLQQALEPIMDSTELEALVNDPELEASMDEGVMPKLLLSGSVLSRTLAGVLTASASNRERAVRQALTQQGYHEEPPGTNANKFSRYFGRAAQPWCADFVSWAFDSTGNRDHRLPWGNPSAVQSFITWATANRHFVTKPVRGDVFVIKNASASHCGLVQAVQGTRFLSIEGNTSRARDSRVIWVAAKWRPINGFRFIRVPAR